ncbi:hypothetical protein Dd703_0780 [Musicola paradisiaca Ech703]|uniref:Uncharacterized protein n=1 Tax=Musicola paradisiaca (strain Ech703) TaxID=579405 RepID=C6CAB6_MUSP7|nr:hypothetical protein Dd703_0780 [Musicola paradisiaca Ech703]
MCGRNRKEHASFCDEKSGQREQVYVGSMHSFLR